MELGIYFNERIKHMPPERQWYFYASIPIYESILSEDNHKGKEWT